MITCFRNFQFQGIFTGNQVATKVPTKSCGLHMGILQMNYINKINIVFKLVRTALLVHAAYFDIVSSKKYNSTNIRVICYIPAL